MILTEGCFVSQCLRTFKARIVDAVLTIVYSFVFCSREFDAKGLPVVGCGDAELLPRRKKERDSFFNDEIDIDIYLMYLLICRFDYILVIHRMLQRRKLVLLQRN